MARHSGSATGRDDILAAATHEFANHGYAGATTAAIARRAGVTQPSVHYHFGSKQKLWDEVLASLFGDLREELSAAMRAAEGLDPEQRLRHLLRQFVRFSGRRPEVARLVRTESVAGGDSFRGLFEDWMRDPLQLLKDEVGRAVDAGLLRPMEPGFLYFFLVGASTQPFAVPAAASAVYDLDVADAAVIDAYADFTADTLLDGIRARPT